MNNKGTLILLFSIVLLGGFVAFTSSLQDGTLSPVLPQSAENPSELLSVALEVQETLYELKIAEGSSVYDLLAVAQETTDFTFAGREFAGLGFYVDSVNGKKEGNNKYWIYYINGQKAHVGVSWYQLNNHDTITFHLEDEE